MRASQELRWKQSIKENEERRRRYEETSRRIENEQRAKVQDVLERRRLERARMDELMRNPAQQPAPPTKPILRKGAGAVLRTQATATAAGSHAATQPPAGATPPSPQQGRLELEGQRREWSEGLKQYIARQREALKAASDGQGSDQAGALSWQELKLAAEAGFEELLRHQEAAAASQQAGSAANARCPGMLRPKGGGAVIKPPVSPQAAGAADAGMPTCLMAAPQPSAAAVQGCSQSSSSSPTSKWALRMKQMLDSAMQNTSAGPERIPPTAAAAAPEECAMEQADLQVQLSQHLQDQEQLGMQAEQQQLNLALCSQGDAAETGGPAAVAAEAASCGGTISVPEALGNKHMACVQIPEMQSGGPHSDSSPHSAARSPGAGSIQQMSAAAQTATAALRESMEKLHRATDVMLSAALHIQNAANVTAAAASRSGTPAPEASSASTGLCSPASQTLQQVAAEGSSAAAVMIRYGAGGCLVDTVAASAASSKTTGASSMSSSPRVRLGAESIAQSTAEPHHTTHSIEAGAAATIPTANGCMFHVHNEVLESSQHLHMVDPTQGAKLKHIKEQSVQQQQQQQQEVQQQKGAQQMQQVEQPDSAHQHVGQEEGQVMLQPMQHDATRTIEPLVIQPETFAAEPPAEAGLDNQPAATQQQQLAAAKAAPAEAQDNFGLLAAAGQQQEAAENAAAGPTLDSLLAEVQQLAALRKALKAEFVAMGHDHIAAAMGTLGLSQEKGLSIQQLQPLKQLQPTVMMQEPEKQHEVEQSLQRQNELLSVELTNDHPSAQAPSICSVGQKATAQQAVYISAEERVKQLISQLPAPEQRPNMPVAVHSAAAAVVAHMSSLGQQTLSKFLDAGLRDIQVLQQQQLIQKAPVSSEIVLQCLNAGSKHQQQCAAAEGGCLSAAESSTAALSDLELAVFAGQDPASSLPGCTGKSDLANTLAAAPMDLSFSFGLAAVQQQHDLSHPASPQLMPEGLQVVLQLEPAHSAIQMQACTQRTDPQPDLASWQKQPQQQKPPTVQRPLQPALSAQQVQQTQQQQQQLGYQPQPLDSSISQTAAKQVPALPALLQWNLPAQITAPAAAAVKPVQAQAEMAMPMHVGPTAIPVVLPSEVPQVPYMPQQAEFVGHFVPAVMQPASVVAVKPCSSSNSSLCSSPIQRPAVISSWITGSPTSTRQGLPLPSPGRIGALAAAAARNPAPSSPINAAAGAKRSGSGFLDKLSKQASLSRNSPAGSGAASAAGKPTSAGGGGARGLPAAERQLVNQGSYLIAALQSKQRMEKEQAERQRLQEAAAAAKQAAARKVQPEWQEAQKLAAVKAAQQVAPIAIGSYAHTGIAAQPQQQHASPTKSPGQPRSGSSTPQHASCTQPSPPAAQNSSPSPPRRVVRAALNNQVPAAGQPVQRIASCAANSSISGSGFSTPSQPASRIPSAPGTPLAKPASPTLPAAQQRPISGVQPPGGSTWAGGARGLADSCDSDFDHLERELNDVDDQQMVSRNRPPSRSHVMGRQQAAQAAAPTSAPAPVVPVQKAIEAAVATATTGNKQGMWVAVQAAAAAAMSRNATKHQQAPAVAAEDMLNSRVGGMRPPTLHIPVSNASSVAATPAPATATSTASAAIRQAAAKPRATRTPSSLLGGQAQQSAAVGQQQQQRRASGARSATPPKASGTVKGRPLASATPAISKVSAAAAAANANALLEAQRLSLEEAELLASLQQLDNMQAQAKQQTAYGGHIPAPAASTPGVLVEPQSVYWRGKAAAGRSAKQEHAALSSARPGNNRVGVAVAGSRHGHVALESPMPDASWGALPASSGHTAAGAAVVGSKQQIPSPNKAKEQRETKLAAARAPATGGPPSKTSKQAATPSTEATSPSVSVAAAGLMHAAGIMPVGWPNFCQSSGGYIPVQPGQQYPQMLIAGGSIPPGFCHPAMAWDDMDTVRQQQHGLGPHAAAALAAAAPAHFQQPGQLGMCGPPMMAVMGSKSQMCPGQGVAPPMPYSLAPGQQQQQQQQMYWAAMQAQQYQQWRQQQQQMGVVYPGTAGGVIGYSRPGTGTLSQLQPPLSAPGGSQYMPGSPLLPTLHYQQTVMRNRTSTAGDSGDSSSGHSSDAGYEVPPVHRAYDMRTNGRGHAMGWQQQQGSAEVWPPRGVEKAHCKGTMVAGNGRQGQKGDSGTVHVYKPGLLL